MLPLPSAAGQIDLTPESTKGEKLCFILLTSISFSLHVLLTGRSKGIEINANSVISATTFY